MLVFFGVLLVLGALHRRRRPQHGPRRGLYRTCRAELLKLLLFWHRSHLITKGLDGAAYESTTPKLKTQPHIFHRTYHVRPTSVFSILLIWSTLFQLQLWISQLLFFPNPDGLGCTLASRSESSVPGSSVAHDIRSLPLLPLPGYGSGKRSNCLRRLRYAAPFGLLC